MGWSWCSHQASKLLDPVIMAVVVGCLGGVGCCVRTVKWTRASTACAGESLWLVGVCGVCNFSYFFCENAHER